MEFGIAATQHRYNFKMQLFLWSLANAYFYAQSLESKEYYYQNATDLRGRIWNCHKVTLEVDKSIIQCFTDDFRACKSDPVKVGQFVVAFATEYGCQLEILPEKHTICDSIIARRKSYWVKQNFCNIFFARRQKCKTNDFRECKSGPITLGSLAVAYIHEISCKFDMLPKKHCLCIPIISKRKSFWVESSFCNAGLPAFLCDI